MGLNFLGLGFSLGAEDKGLANALKNTTSGLADISKSVIGIGLASAKMAFKLPDPRPAAGVMQTLANDVKTTTTALEAYGVMASKATSAGLAGLNLTEKEFKKAQSLVSNVAFSMNTDVGGVTKSFVALKQAGVDVNSQAFRKMFGSFEDYQKFIEVSGTDTVAFAGALGTLENQMGLTADQINDSVKAVAAIGKKFNIGREAIANMSNTVKLLNENANRLPENWSPAKMQSFLKGTAAVSGALTSVGLTADEAISASNGLTKALLAGQQGMSELYSGLADQIPGGMDVLTQHLGKMDDAFKMLQESPDQFMLKMGKLVDDVGKMDIKPEAMDRFRLQMDKTFGPDVMAAFNKKGFGKIGPALEKANDPIKDQGDAIKNLSKRYQDGRTHAERFALAQDRVQTELKKVKGVMSDSQYLKEYNKQSKEFLGTMNSLAAQGGPIGKATALLIDFKMRGVGGALAAHSKWGFMISEGMKVLQPFLAYLPAIGAALTALLSPIGLVAAAIGGLFFLFKDLDKGDKSIIRPYIDKLVAEAPVLFAKAKDLFLRALAFIGQAITYVVERIDFNKVGQVLGDILSKAMEVGIVILKAAFRLGERLLMWLDGLDWGAIGKKAGGYFAQIGEVVLGAIVKVISNLPEIMVKIFQKAVDLVVGILDGIRDYLVKKFPEAAKPIIFIFEMIKAAVKIVGGAFQLAWKAIGWILGTIWDIVKGIFSVIGTIVKAVAGALSWAFGLIKDAVSWIWDKLKAVGSAIGSVVGGIKGALGSVGGFFSGVGSSIAGLFSSSRKESGVTLQKVIADQIELNKRIAAEAKKRNIELAKQGNERAMKEEGYVKTIEGNIIRSVDSLTQYVKDAQGKIKETYVTAAQYSKGFVQGEAWEELEKMQEGIRKESAILRGKNFKSGSEEQEKWFKDMDAMLEGFDKQHEEYQKKFGVRWDIMYAANEAIKGQFAIQTELLDKIKASSIGYYTTMTGLQKSLSAEAGELKLQMLKLEAAGDASSEKYMALQKKYLESMAEGKAKLDKYAEVLSGQLATSMDKYANDIEKRAQQAAINAKIISEGYKNNIVEMLKGIPEASKAVGDTVTKMMNDLGRAQELEIREFLKTTKLTGAELNKAVGDITNKYKIEQEKITGILKTQHDALMVGAVDDANALLATLQKSQDVMLKKVKATNAEAATEIQKQFGVTGDAALESVNQIAAVDPKIFQKNMAAVKASFMGFLKEMDDRGKKLMDNTTKSFNTLWETMDKGWKQNKKLMEDFGASADKMIDAFWKTIIEKSQAAGNKFIEVTKNIQASLMAMTKSFSLMDLLASPNDITRWAASVVSALAYAFRTGGAADAMISASYQKALAMASEISTQAGATPDAGSKPAVSSGAMQATMRLIDVINHPAWAHDPKEPIPATLKEMNDNLKATLAALAALAEGKAAGRTGKGPPNNTRK
jgi:hypothetical protein